MVDLLQKPVTPEYPGVRRTLEFRNLDGRKTDWFMHEYQRIMLQYQQVDDNKSPALLLQVIRITLHSLTSESNYIWR